MAGPQPKIAVLRNPYGSLANIGYANGQDLQNAEAKKRPEEKVFKKAKKIVRTLLG